MFEIAAYRQTPERTDGRRLTKIAIAGLVGPVNMLSDNGCVYKNMSFSERKTIK